MTRFNVFFLVIFGFIFSHKAAGIGDGCYNPNTQPYDKEIRTCGVNPKDGTSFMTKILPDFPARLTPEDLGIVRKGYSVKIQRSFLTAIIIPHQADGMNVLGIWVLKDGNGKRIVEKDNPTFCMNCVSNGVQALVTKDGNQVKENGLEYIFSPNNKNKFTPNKVIFDLLVYQNTTKSANGFPVPRQTGRIQCTVGQDKRTSQCVTLT